MKFFKGPKAGGFTLVELLIVIALIAILSVAVLATINPIEQTNKARDAKFKNDTAEVLSAYERFYASQNSYPWNDPTIANFVAQGTAGAFRSDSQLFGVLGATGSGSTGALVTTSELKSAFIGKEPFTKDFATESNRMDAMYVWNNGLDSNYVCFVPKAQANRVKTAELKCLSGVGSGATLEDYGDNACTTVSTWAATAAQIGPHNNITNLMCVPEGKVN